MLLTILLTILLTLTNPAAAESWRALSERGDELRKIGQCRQAVPILTRARAVAERELGSHHSSIAIPLNNLGVAHLCLGELRNAKGEFDKALELLDESSSALKAGVLNNLGIALIRMSLITGAEKVLTKSLAISEQIYGRNAPETVAAVTSLGMARLHLGDYRRAGELFARALAAYDSPGNKNELNRATLLNNLGVVSLYLGDYQQAQVLTAEALVLRRQLLPATHDDIAQSLSNHAAALEKLGLHKVARRTLAEAASVRLANRRENLLGFTVDAADLRR